MSGARVPFDPALPFVVATPDLPCGPKRFTRGDAFPWPELGLSQYDLAMLWIANAVDCVAPPNAPEPAPKVAPLAQQHKPAPSKQQSRR